MKRKREGEETIEDREIELKVVFSSDDVKMFSSHLCEGLDVGDIFKDIRDQILTLKNCLEEERVILKNCLGEYQKLLEERDSVKMNWKR